METVTDFLFLGSKITADGDCSHEIKKCLLLGNYLVSQDFDLLIQYVPQGLEERMPEAHKTYRFPLPDSMNFINRRMVQKGNVWIIWDETFLEIWGEPRCFLGFPGGASGKEPACQWRRHKKCGFDPWIGEIPWRRAWQLTPVFLLEIPMDRGAWGATVHGVAKIQTRLKWLSTGTQMFLGDRKLHSYSYLVSSWLFKLI